MHTNLVWVPNVLRFLYSKIKSLPKHPTHDVVFHNKYLKLFGMRPNTICPFGLHIKQILTASNIAFSDISERPSVVFYHLLCINSPIIVLDLVQPINNHSWKFESGTVIIFLFI